MIHVIDFALLYLFVGHIGYIAKRKRRQVRCVDVMTSTHALLTRDAARFG